MRVRYCHFERTWKADVSHRELDLVGASWGQLVKVPLRRNFYAFRVKQIREKSLVWIAIRVASYHRNSEWDIWKVHVSDEFEEFPVGILRLHLQLLNSLALFGYQIKLGSLCCAGRERGLKRCRRSRHGLPLYSEQSFVTETAAYLHKLDTDEKISLCASASIQNLPVPVISARHFPTSGEITVTIRPQFNSVTVLVQPELECRGF